MLNQLKTLFLISLFAISILSCSKSVWENRQECPCILTLNLSNVDKSIDTLHLWIFGSDNNILYRDTISSHKFETPYEVLINREMVKYFLWGNIKRATHLEDNLTINSTLAKWENLSADSLYHYSHLLNTNCEFAYDTVLMNKEFITVDVSLQGGNYDNDLKIEQLGNSSGFYVDKRFINGTGKITRYPDYKDNYKTLFSYRITRQSSLPDITMSIISTRKGIPTVLAGIPVGIWLQDSGYNMYAPNLSDIKIELDLSVGFITAKIDDWQITVPANVEI